MQKNTVLAVVVFVVLAGAAFWTLTRKAERGIERISWAALNPNFVDAIDIKGPLPVELRREAGVWRLPNGREADSDAVNNLLANTTRIQSSDQITQDSNRFPELEVDDAKGHTVKLLAHGKTVAEFTVGKYVNGGTAVRQDHGVYKVTNVFGGAFGRAANDWLQRRLFTDKPEDLARVTVKLTGAAPYTLVQKEKGWELLDAKEAPAGFRFDATAAQALASALVNVQVQDILDKDPGAETTKFDADADTFTWFFKDAALATTQVPSRTLHLGATRDDKAVYAKVEGKADLYTIPDATAQGFKRSLTDLRDLTLVHVDVSKIVGVTINDGKKTLKLEKVAGQWQLPKGEKLPPGAQIDGNKVFRRITGVANSRALQLAKTQSPGSTGLTAPKVFVTLTNDAKEAASLAFGSDAKEQPNAFYARGNVDGLIYVVAKALKDQLVGGLDTLKPDVDPWSQVDPKSLESLPADVRASLQQQMAQKKREADMLKQLQNHPGTASN